MEDVVWRMVLPMENGMENGIEDLERRMLTGGCDMVDVDWRMRLGGCGMKDVACGMEDVEWRMEWSLSRIAVRSYPTLNR